MRKYGIIHALSGLGLGAFALGGPWLAGWGADLGLSRAGGDEPPTKPDDTVQKKVPGSKAHFTEAGVNDRFNVPDWFPGDHPPLPDVVAHGRTAQGLCLRLLPPAQRPGAA